jgi:hypothetical protein
MNTISKSFSIFLFAFQLIVFTDTLAHEGHDHELSKEQAIERAASAVAAIVDGERAIEGGTLDDSWKQAANTATCKETPQFYLISFHNRAAGRTLYVLLTSVGKYMRANFDGHFADLVFSPYPLQSC